MTDERLLREAFLAGYLKSKSLNESRSDLTDEENIEEGFKDFVKKAGDAATKVGQFARGTGAQALGKVVSGTAKAVKGAANVANKVVGGVSNLADRAGQAITKSGDNYKAQQQAQQNNAQQQTTQNNTQKNNAQQQTTQNNANQNNAQQQSQQNNNAQQNNANQNNKEQGTQQNANKNAKLNAARLNNKKILKALKDAGIDTNKLIQQKQAKNGKNYSAAAPELNNLRKLLFGESLNESDELFLDDEI